MKNLDNILYFLLSLMLVITLIVKIVTKEWLLTTNALIVVTGALLNIQIRRRT